MSKVQDLVVYDIGLIIHNINIHQAFPVTFRDEEVIHQYQLNMGKEFLSVSTEYEIYNEFEDNNVVFDIEDSLENTIKRKFRIL
jgi:hypothetical protein